LKQKTDILNHIIDGFSSISHSMRGLFVEWIIVILILVEIILIEEKFTKPMNIKTSEYENNNPFFGSVPVFNIRL
jgi:uncharacterized Rmd1/YagE family protein